MAAQLNPDGTCVLTELLPEYCSCKDHRNSPEVALLDGTVARVAHSISSRYAGRCVVDPSHEIEPGDDIYLLVNRPPTGADDDSIGWACERCAVRIEQSRG